MTSDDHSEGRIRAAVVEGVRHLEAPDRHRLARIEQRLLEQGRQRRHRWSLWWGVLGIVAAGGAAAYWALATDIADSGQPPAPVLEDEASSSGTASSGSTGPDGEDDESERRGQSETDNPVIYIGQ